MKDDQEYGVYVLMTYNVLLVSYFWILHSSGAALSLADYGRFTLSEAGKLLTG